MSRRFPMAFSVSSTSRRAASKIKGLERWIPRGVHIAQCMRNDPNRVLIVNRFFSQMPAIRQPIVSTMQAQDLPQGLLDTPSSEPMLEPTVSGYPTVIQQALNNMRKFENCVVITRVGNFYEFYFEQADIYGPLLNLKVASRRARDTTVSMAGFPFYQLDRYLKILVQDYGKHVAISEEVAHTPAEKVKSGGLLFNREVKRVVTPGTLIDELFLDPLENNYLLAISMDPELLGKKSDQLSSSETTEGRQKVGVSWLDLSSGDFYTQSTDIALVSSAIARVRPREIIVDDRLEHFASHAIKNSLEEQGHSVNYFHSLGTGEQAANMFTEERSEDLLPEERSASTLIAEYVEVQMPGLRLELQAPERRLVEEHMTIDKHSLRGLEIVRTLRDGNYKGSLLHAVRRTCTESGARLLARRIASPSLSLPQINERLDVVDELLKSKTFREEITILLKRTYDTLRLIQKFAFGRGDADDLLRLSRTINVTAEIGALLERHSRTGTGLQRLSSRLQYSAPTILAERILLAIDQGGLQLRQHQQDVDIANSMSFAADSIGSEGDAIDMEPLTKRLKSKKASKANDGDDEKLAAEDIWIMRRSASRALEQLHGDLESLVEERAKLRSNLAERLGATTLALKMTPGLGHICHIKGKDIRSDLSILEQARVVSASKSTRSFYVPEWTALGRQIEDAKLRIRSEEQLIFQDLREDVVKNLVTLRRNAAVLDDLDVSCSFASLADECDLRRPTLTNTCHHKIIGGRHLTVEAALGEEGRNFTQNDCVLDDTERVWLITGPNMAGKSTFLRQTALISLLAQTGSFVPADFAEIGLVDQVFSRIGSADNVSQEQSTFMVEMLETAHILKHSTRRSLVIMDEVGRGTTPEDGTAVGYAVLDYLHNRSKCRVLFATHFDALADMTSHWEHLACYSTNVIEEGDGAFRYDHRLRPGVNREPHSLKVARLAGMPESVISTAREALQELRSKKTESS